MNSLKTKVFSGFLSATLVSASLSHVPAAFSITCNNDTRSFQCLDQTGGDLWEQGSSHAPKHANNDERETSSSQAGNVEDDEAYRRWYGEHHHGNLGFAQDKSGANKSFRFDVANDGSYCVSRDGRVGQYKEFTDDGQAKPVGETITNHLFGDTCTLNDPEAAQQAQSEYERIITEMHTICWS